MEKLHPIQTVLHLDGFTREHLLSMLKRMIQAREFEEQLYYLFLTRTMPGTMHQATGQEAVAVGICAALQPDDYVTSTHRGHAHCIGKGVPLNEMMAEMFAKRNGSCKGMGGSMHLCDFEKGMLGAFGIVGAGIPIATGAALSAVRPGCGEFLRRWRK
jgi:acetoin:2,6-dichlorophenolindophenol oxidoreductase subunit alpha